MAAEPSLGFVRQKNRPHQRIGPEPSAAPATRLANSTIQQAAGNMAIQQLARENPFALRMLHARQTAHDEGVSYISPRTQSLIDGEKRNGHSLDEQARAALEPITGSDLSGMRLHYGPAAAGLSRTLGARAFTQGRDVFLGTEVRDNTLAHEAVHVAENRTGPGTIQRDSPNPDQKPDDSSHPSSAYGAPKDANTVRNSASRLNYAQLIKENASTAVSQIREAKRVGDIHLAERLARGAYEFRKDLRVSTRESISPGAVAMSEAYERDRSWETLMEKYTKPDPFETYESIAAASGRTDSLMTSLGEAGAYGGALMFGWDFASGVDEVINAPDGKRLQVASEVVGGGLGTYVGTEGGMALGAAGAAALLSNPGGWAVLAGLGLGYLGGRFGGEIGSAIFGAPFRLVESLEQLIKSLPLIMDVGSKLGQVMVMPARQILGLIGGVPIRIQASLNVNNWDLRYFPPEVRADALVIGGTVWQQVESLGADELVEKTSQKLSDFGVPEDAVERLAHGLSSPDRTYAAQELLAMSPMEFMDLLRSKELGFTQSPEYLQGWSTEPSKAQFYDRPLIRLRNQLDPDNWTFDRESDDTAPIESLGSTLWEKLEPLKEKDFDQRSRLTLKELGIDDETLKDVAEAIARIAQRRSTNKIQWGVDPEMLGDLTLEGFISFLNDTAGMNFSVSPDVQADIAVQGIRSGLSPW